MKLEIITYPIMSKEENDMTHYTDIGIHKTKLSVNGFLKYLQDYLTEHGMEIYAVTTPGNIHIYHLVKK